MNGLVIYNCSDLVFPVIKFEILPLCTVVYCVTVFEVPGTVVPWMAIKTVILLEFFCTLFGDAHLSRRSLRYYNILSIILIQSIRLTSRHKTKIKIGEKVIIWAWKSHLQNVKSEPWLGRNWGAESMVMAAYWIFL